MNHDTERIRGKSQSWDGVANWYAGWSGPHGSRHHRDVAIPALIDLLAPMPGEAIIDIGCGPGALAPHIVRAKSRYFGVDLSAKLIAVARAHHGAKARFVIGDATHLSAVAALAQERFDAATYLLSLQDINPLEEALASVSTLLKRQARIVILMTHPCFRIPRQSGWGWDEGRRLQYRRIDRYMTPLEIPMQQHEGRRGGITRSYHRPLESYISALADNDFAIEKIREIPLGPPQTAAQESRSERLAREQIPLFLGIKAYRRV